MNIEIRPATEQDVLEMQTLRKEGWQDNYVNEETGVTKDILVNELATLPVPEPDLIYNKETLNQPINKGKSLVAVQEGKIVGVVFYDKGDIGVFVDRNQRGRGVGSMLLESLIRNTDSDIEVTIFAKNQSRNLYKKFGFVEEGEEGIHTFREGVALPIQKLVLRRSKE
jgi:GNAT superfamily N-acetyltransferase